MREYISALDGLRAEAEDVVDGHYSYASRGWAGYVGFGAIEVDVLALGDVLPRDDG